MPLKVDLICKINDEWYTPENAIEPIFKYLKPNSKILCPFDKYNSNFVKLLIREGHIVHYSHIDHGIDFFKLKKTDVISYDYLISNPPFSKKNEVLKHLFYLKRPFLMLFGISGLFESIRYEMFKKNKIGVIIFDKRVRYISPLDSQKTTNPPFSSWYITYKVKKAEGLNYEILVKNKRNKDEQINNK